MTCSRKGGAKLPSRKLQGTRRVNGDEEALIVLLKARGSIYREIAQGETKRRQGSYKTERRFTARNMLRAALHPRVLPWLHASPRNRRHCDDLCALSPHSDGRSVEPALDKGRRASQGRAKPDAAAVRLRDAPYPRTPAGACQLR